MIMIFFRALTLMFELTFRYVEHTHLTSKKKNFRAFEKKNHRQKTCFHAHIHILQAPKKYGGGTHFWMWLKLLALCRVLRVV